MGYIPWVGFLNRASAVRVRPVPYHLHPLHRLLDETRQHVPDAYIVRYSTFSTLNKPSNKNQLEKRKRVYLILKHSPPLR